MLEGFWTVVFDVEDVTGTGVVVLMANKKFVGGDSGHTYIGTFNETANRMNGELQINRFNPNYLSVFGNLKTFSMSFSGEILTPDRVECEGSTEPVSRRIRFVMRRHANL